MSDTIGKTKTNRALLAVIIGLSLPAIGEMALNTMLGVADTIMISRFIGKEALAAVGFANQIVFFLIFVFSSFNTGAVALVSRRLGERDFVRLKRTAEQNVTVNLVIGLAILTLSLLFHKPMFLIFDTTPEIYRATLSYFSLILIGLVPMFLCFSFAAILRGAGDTRTPMVITGIANLTNIAGNYLLITGAGPFPEMGIAGAALSTSLSRILALILYVYVLYVKRSPIKLKPELFLDKAILKPLVRISLPGAVEQALMQLSFLTMAVIVSQLDTLSEAAFRILIQIESLSFMPAVGLSIATATMVGKSLGEKDVDKASRTGYLSLGLSAAWGVVIGGVFLFFPRFILALFSEETDLILTALPVMLFLGLNQIGLNGNIVLGGALRGAGDTRPVMINTVLRLWLIFIPLSWLFVIRSGWGIKGVWVGEMASFALFGSLLFLRFRSRRWASLTWEDN